jgi:SAM-dependent methyltransferase
MGLHPFGLESPAAARDTIVEWEECGCLLCGGRHWSILVEAQDPLPGEGGLWFAVVQCQECGLCFTNPRPSERCIAEFYRCQYPPLQVRAQRKARRWWRRFPPWRRWRDRRECGIAWHGQGRLLDFGCGNGRLMARLQRRGWQVVGVDASAEAVRQVRAELGLRALTGSLPHPELAGERFDVITMLSALEHVHEPLLVLRAAHDLLAPGGQLIVLVPNIDSLPFRWFGKDWFGLDLPRHLVHFTPVTLEQMLRHAGFEVGPVRMVRHSDWLRSSARLAARRPGASAWRRLLRLKAVSSLASWYTYLMGWADCIRVVATRRQEASLQAGAAGVDDPFTSPAAPPPRDRFRNR